MKPHGIVGPRPVLPREATLPLLALCSLLGSLSSLSSCSDSEVKTSAQDSGPPHTDALLYPCSEPGLACNAHDPCAINPICSKDGLCHPETFQDCNDGLECTQDSCGQIGQCLNKPKEGTCALLIKAAGGSQMKCFNKDAVNPSEPCMKCDPATSQTQWSPANGGACEDGDPCTKDDSCQEGICKGNAYGPTCNDGLTCTDDTCDGKGGCSNKLQSGTCLIDNACYKDKASAASGCKICDAAKDPYHWTQPSSLCKIGDHCYRDGELDSSGCGICDVKNPTSWTPAPGVCFIQGSCKKPGDKDSASCGICDPPKSQSDWTPPAGKCLIQSSCSSNGDKSPSGCGLCDTQKNQSSWTPVAGASIKITGFNGDLGGYVVDPLVSNVGWQLTTQRTKSGAGSLYYGNLSAKNFDTGSANKGVATSPSIALPSGQKAALQFWLYLDTEVLADHDMLQLKVGSQLLWSKNSVTMPLSNYRRWVLFEVDLSSFAGQSIQLGFSFDTKDAWANGGEGVFIDEVTLVTNCGS